MCGEYIIQIIFDFEPTKNNVKFLEIQNTLQTTDTVQNTAIEMLASFTTNN